MNKVDIDLCEARRTRFNPETRRVTGPDSGGCAVFTDKERKMAIEVSFEKNGEIKLSAWSIDKKYDLKNEHISISIVKKADKILVREMRLK